MVDIVTLAAAKAGAKSYTDDAIDRALTSVYKYMGQCTNAQLSSKAKTKGNVWEITDDGTFSAGTDVVYNGTAWAAMAGQIHVDVVNSLTSTSTADALSANMGRTLSEGKQDKLPSTTANAGKVLKVNSAGTGVEWAADLHAEFYLDVTLTASAGSPSLEGVTITATPTSGQIIQGVTDAQGKCRLIVAQGATYSVAGAKTGYNVSSTSVTVTSLTTTAALTCYVLPTVAVTVTTATEHTISDLAVTATPTAAGTAVTGRTDANGECTLTLGVGEWTVAVTSDMGEGYSISPSSSAVTAAAGGEYTADFTISENAPTPTGAYGYAAVDIAISESDPASRCTYPQTITVNGATVDNSCYGYTPMSGSAGGTFSDGSWGDHFIVTNIKPVVSDGAATPTFTDAATDASTWTTGAEYFTEFPFNWLSITNDGSKIRIIFSDNDTQPDSTFQCYAHARACDSYSNSQIETAMGSVSKAELSSNSYFADAFHLGCFGGNITDSKLYSKCSTTYSGNDKYANYWQWANARGGEYDCYSFQQMTYLQALFVLLYRSTDSQGAHSQGLAKVASETLAADTTNAPLSTDGHGMHGKVGVAERNSFFWLHDLWGNMYQFIGGAWNRAGSTSKLYYWLPRQANSRAFNNGWTAATTYATQASLGDDTGLTGSNSGGFIYTTAGTNKGGFCPTSQSGASATTYWCDYGNVYYYSSLAIFPNVGGSTSGSTGIAGVFCCYVYFNSTYSYSNVGSRLSYRGGH